MRAIGLTFARRTDEEPARQYDARLRRHESVLGAIRSPLEKRRSFLSDGRFLGLRAQTRGRSTPAGSRGVGAWGGWESGAPGRRPYVVRTDSAATLRSRWHQGNRRAQACGNLSAACIGSREEAARMLQRFRRKILGDTP